MFLTVETLPMNCCRTMGSVLYCTVSDFGGTPMMICTYHYRIDGPH